MRKRALNLVCINMHMLLWQASMLDHARNKSPFASPFASPK